MQIVLTVGLGCERLIYTAFVNLTNTRITHGTHLIDNRTASMNIPSFYYSRRNVDRYSVQTVPLV